ncbi:putative ribonuclease H-like domain-containing protein [Tanacetum coccineum]
MEMRRTTLGGGALALTQQMVFSAKGLTSPEQTATGKGISNPFMAVMVCQKPYGIQLTNVSRVNTPGSDENSLKLYDLISNRDDTSVPVSKRCCKEQGAASNSRKSNVVVPNILKDKVYNNFQKLKDEGFLYDGMEHGFFIQKRGGGGIGIREKQHGVKEKLSTNGDSAKRNSSGGSPGAVKDVMDYGPDPTLFVDLKVMEGVDESVSTIPKSFMSLVTNEVVTSKVNFRSLDSDKPINAKAKVKIPKASILDIHSIFGFSLYGYFVGLFFFKFASIEGMNEILENGPWFICSTLIILKKWMPNANLLKEDLKSVPIWVKLHDIPIVAFTAHGLSVMATNLVIVIPNVEANGEVLHTVRVEYEWEPLRCVSVKPKKPIRQVISKKNSANSSGKYVVQDVAGLASSSQSNTPFVARINDLVSQMIKGKLVLLDDKGKPLKPSKSTLPSSSNMVYKKFDDLVNKDNDSEVEEWRGNKSLYEQLKKSQGEDSYDDDDFDDPCFSDAQMKLAWIPTNPARRILVCLYRLRVVRKTCAKWDWFDEEPDSDWYKMYLYEMYNQLNPNKRRQLDHERSHQARTEELEAYLDETRIEL